MANEDAGPLEDAVGATIAMRRSLHGAEPYPVEILEELYKDAAAAREVCNAHMGELQRWIGERKDLLARAEQREGREHERETDPILRPDGRC